MEEFQNVFEYENLLPRQLLAKFQSILDLGLVKKMILKVSFVKISNPKKDDRPFTKGHMRTSSTSRLRKKTQKPKTAVKEDNKNRGRIAHQAGFNAKGLIQRVTKLYDDQNYEEVIRLLSDEEQKLATRTPNPSIPAGAMDYNFITFYLANCHFRLKEYKKAELLYLKKKGQEPIKQHAQRLNNLGACYAMEKNYTKGLKAYNEAIKLYNCIPEENTSNLLSNIATIYKKSEMYKQAEEYFTLSIAERRLKSPFQKQILFNCYFQLGVCQKQLMKIEESLKNFELALNLVHEGYGSSIKVLKEMCITYEMGQRYSQALQNYEELSELFQKEELCQGFIYERVSKIHETLGNTSQSLIFSEMAYKMYTKNGDDRKASEVRRTQF